MADDLTSFLSPVRGNDTPQNREQLQSLNSLAENFDNFLTILTTQLQNQDPLSPLDTHEFTNQLVMFADVEQSVRQSGQLDDLITVNRQNEASAAVGYIGNEIQADYNEVNYTGEPVELTYTLPEDAAQAALEVYNSQGDLVAILAGVPKEFGEHTVTWDGNENTAEPGSYSFQIGAHNKDEETIDATYKTRGTVTGVEYENGNTMLLMGNVKVPLERVLRVEDPVS